MRRDCSGISTYMLAASSFGTDALHDDENFGRKNWWSTIFLFCSWRIFIQQASSLILLEAIYIIYLEKKKIKLLNRII